MDRRARDYILSQQLRNAPCAEDTRGKPLELRPRNFKLSLQQQIQGYFGPPAFAARARNIELALEALYQRLAEDYAHLSSECGDDDEAFAGRWLRYVESLDLDRINRLITEHNAYYPVEANLRVDPAGGGYLLGSEPWEPTPPVSHAQLLSRFPPERSLESTG